jgi:hypothetical protein
VGRNWCQTAWGYCSRVGALDILFYFILKGQLLRF